MHKISRNNLYGFVLIFLVFGILTWTTPSFALDRTTLQADRLLPGQQLMPNVRTLPQGRVKLWGERTAQTRRDIGNAGVSRDQLTIPVSPVEQFTDTTLFEGAADPTQKFYIPRYRLGEQNVSGQPQYRLTFERGSQGWDLAVYLDGYIAPDIGEAGQQATTIDPKLSVILRHRLQVGTTGESQKELEFQEVTTTATGLRAALHVDTLTEMDRLYRALTDPGYATSLLVQRSVNVAIPVVQTEVSSGSTVLHSPAPYGPDTCLQGYVWREAFPQDHVCVPPETRSQAAFDNSQAAARRNPNGGPYGPDTCLQGYVWRDAIQGDHVCVPGETRTQAAQDNAQAQSRVARGSWSFAYDTGSEDSNGADVKWEQQTPTTRLLTPQGGAKIAFLGVRDFDAITLQDLQGLSYDTNAIPDNANAHATGSPIFAVLTKGGNYAKVQVLSYAYNPNSYDLTQRWVTYQPNPGAAGGGMLFREVSTVLNNTIEPNPFVFSPSLHSYIFRNITPGPNQSTGLIRRTASWNGIHYSYYQDQAQPELFFYLPDSFKIGRRLEAPHYPTMVVQFTSPDGDRQNLQATLEYTAVPFVNMERLVAATPTLKSFVGTTPAGSTPEPRFEPLVAKVSQFRVALPRADSTAGPYQDRVNASVDLQRGILRDTLNLPLEQFQALYHSMFGTSAVLFQGEIVVDIGGGIRDEIPFAARMNDLVGELFTDREIPDDESGGVRVTWRNAIESPVKINRVTAELTRGGPHVAAEVRNLTLPLELRPGEEVTFVIAPAAPLEGPNSPQAVIVERDLDVLPDRDLVWQAILDPTVPAQYTQKVTVKTFSDTFMAPAEHPEKQIRSIIVEFDSGDTVEINADKLQAEATLRLPVSDIVLRRVTDGTYRYRRTVVRRGEQQRDETWTTESSTILILQAN